MRAAYTTDERRHCAPETVRTKAGWIRSLGSVVSKDLHFSWISFLGSRNLPACILGTLWGEQGADHAVVKLPLSLPVFWTEGSLSEVNFMTCLDFPC